MTPDNQPEFRVVSRALYRPLTVWGVDRRLFFLALLVGAAAFVPLDKGVFERRRRRLEPLPARVGENR